MDLDLLSIGDASIDVFMTPTEAESLCQMDDKESFICFSYGDKIPVSNLEFSVGGNAANNAVGMTRLGLKDAIILTLGSDLIGNLITDGLKKEKVDLTYVIQQPAVSSNFSTIINYSGERTIFTYHAPRSYEFPVTLPVTPWIYLTSMGQAFRPFYNHLVDWLKKNPEMKLAFNPGSWQMRVDIENITDVLSLCSAIFLNREEAEKLAGVKESIGKEKELLSAVNKLGPKISVITDGPKGSYVYDARLPDGQGQKFLSCGIMPTEAYERTGAGDAFGTGFLGAIIKGKTIEEALLWGTVNSASVISFVGPQKGLLNEQEILAWVERAKSSGVEVKVF